MVLNNEQNMRYMSDKRRIAAQERLDTAVKRIQASIRSNGNAGYYLTVLPQYLRELESANESLTIIEATVIDEIVRDKRSHG